VRKIEAPEERGTLAAVLVGTLNEYELSHPSVSWEMLRTAVAHVLALIDKKLG
jgi:hypothetical protein